MPWSMFDIDHGIHKGKNKVAHAMKNEKETTYDASIFYFDTDSI